MSPLWLHRRMSKCVPARGRRSRRLANQHRRGVQLVLEPLEDRTLLCASDVLGNIANGFHIFGNAANVANDIYWLKTNPPPAGGPLPADYKEHLGFLAGDVGTFVGSVVGDIPGATTKIIGEATTTAGDLGHLASHLTWGAGAFTTKLGDADTTSSLLALSADVNGLAGGPPIASDFLSGIHDLSDLLNAPNWQSAIGPAANLTGDIVAEIGDLLGGCADDQPLQVSVDPPGCAAGFNFIAPVASFSDPNDFGNASNGYTAQTPLPASSYNAVIDWGDGTSSSGQIVQEYPGGDSYSVIGSHTYAASGDYSVSVMVAGDGTSGSGEEDGTVSPAIEPFSVVPTGGPGAITLGQTFNDILLTFQTNASESQNLQSYTTLINWGDGSSTAGQVVYPHGGAGHLQVTGTHLYTQAGAYTVGVQVTGPDGSSISSNTSVVVNSTGIIAQGINVAPSNLSFNGTIAHFTDTDGDTNPNDFSATVYWGDGDNPSTTPAQVVADGQGGFNVVATRQFPGYGLYLPEVDIVDNTDAAAAVLNSQLAIGGPTVTANNISAAAGQMFSGTLGTFTWPDAAASASDFSVSVDWGDDQSALNVNPQAPQLLANGNGSFSIVGSHVYGGNGTYDVLVSVQPLNGSAPLQADSAATVGSSSLTVTAQNLSIGPSASANLAAPGIHPDTAASGGSINGTVAAFTAPPGTSAGDYTAAINWGDGNTSTGQIIANANGGFNVLGSHTYSQIAGYLTSVQVSDNNGDIASAFGTVSPPLPTSSVNPLPATETSPNFTVRWSGSDPNGPGIASYSVYMSDNGGAFTPWLTGTTQTSATFTGQAGHSYSFYSVAVDQYGNSQPAPTAAQATTTVPTPSNNPGNNNPGNNNPGNNNPGGNQTPAPPDVPPLLAWLNQVLGGIETVYADDTMIADNLFGLPLVETYDLSGNLASVAVLGFDLLPFLRPFLNL